MGGLTLLQQKILCQFFNRDLLSTVFPFWDPDRPCNSVRCRSRPETCSSHVQGVPGSKQVKHIGPPWNISRPAEKMNDFLVRLNEECVKFWFHRWDRSLAQCDQTAYESRLQWAMECIFGTNCHRIGIWLMRRNGYMGKINSGYQAKEQWLSKRYSQSPFHD